DPTFIASRAAMAEAAARHRLPLICGFREMTEAGCLFSYSASLKDIWCRSATYVDKILKGAKPADLPVQQGTKFEFVINLKAARALGIALSPIFLPRPDEVIEGPPAAISSRCSAARRRGRSRRMRSSRRHWSSGS